MEMLRLLSVDDLIRYITYSRDLLNFGLTCKLFHAKTSANDVWIKLIKSSITEPKLEIGVNRILWELEDGHAKWLYFLLAATFVCRECGKGYTIKSNTEDCKTYYHPGRCVNWYYDCCSDYGDGCTQRLLYHKAVFLEDPYSIRIAPGGYLSAIGRNVFLIFKLAYLWDTTKKCTQFNLSRNNLYSLHPCFLLSHITELNLQDNHLTELPEEIGKMNKLASLDIRNNKIKTLPVSMHELYDTLRKLHVSHEYLDEPYKSLLRDGMPVFVVLYYLKCLTTGEEFNLDRIVIPKYHIFHKPYKMKIYLTQTPSVNVPSDYLSYLLVPDSSHIIYDFNIKVDEENTVNLETIIVEAASKTYWNTKYWAEAQGVVVFSGPDGAETEAYINELKPFLPPNTRIMTIEVSMAEKAPNPQDKKSDDSVVLWLEQYDFSELIKDLTVMGRKACKDIKIASNFASDVLPEFEKYQLEVLHKHFDIKKHFFPTLYTTNANSPSSPSVDSTSNLLAKQKVEHCLLS